MYMHVCVCVYVISRFHSSVQLHMPVVWPNGVLGGRNVVQSKRVGRDTRKRGIEVLHSQRSL